jgi:hypothetical protein
MEVHMTNLLLAAIPAFLVLGSLYWTMTMGLREQAESDRYSEAWMRAHLARR